MKNNQETERHTDSRNHLNFKEEETYREGSGFLRGMLSRLSYAQKGGFLRTVLCPILLSSLWLPGGCSTSRSTEDLPAVSGFRVEQYMGTWYEAARLPTWFERGLKDVQADYRIDPDGRILVTNSGTSEENGTRKIIHGVAKAADPSNPGTGELKVSFFGPFYAPYRIIRLNEDYSLAIVTSKTRNYLWVLTRGKRISTQQREECREWLTARDFDVAGLIWNQTEEP